MGIDIEKQEKIAKELFILLDHECPKELRKTLNRMVFEWLEEAEILPENRAALIYRAHLVIEFFEKCEEIMANEKK